VLCTKKGVIKKTALTDFSRPRTTGVNAITIIEGDQLLEAKLTDGACEIMMAINSGRAIRFPESKVRPTGRGAIGVTGIEVEHEGEEVVGMICVNPESQNERTVLVVSEKGFGKRTPVDEYRITNRGGKGVKTISVTEKTGKLVGMVDVAEKEDLMISCKSGITIRMNVAAISEQGRATQGVKLIRIDEGDEIAALTKLDVEDEADVLAEIENSLAETAEGVEAGGEIILENNTTETTDLPDNPSEGEEDSPIA
jgi:DNA gyrase subunit A